MCGINGIYDLKSKNNTERNNMLVHEMNERITYRGPDHEGMYQYDNLTMGMRRLSIQDLKSGNQPIYNEDRTIVVVFNGEIYNFKLLQEELREKGHHFYTTTDTEVIVHGYEEYGENIFDKLDGMFAISLFDTNRKILVLARDRMGEKPLYIFHDNDWVIWGSELKSVIGTGIIPKEINRKALNQYFQLTYIPSPLTIYENVYKVMPGQFIVVNEVGELSEHRYWNLRDIEKNMDISYEDAKRHLNELVHQSIKNRIISDVPIGAFLSGGVDSSVITSIMAELSDVPVNTFTMGFNEKAYDERSRAKLIAEKQKTAHHEYILNYDEALEKIDELLEKMDEPFADSSMIPTYFVSQFASQYVKVVLTGDAGDELFLGYSKYLVSYYSDLFKRFPKFMQTCFRKLVLCLPDRSSISRKVRKVLDCYDKDIFGQRISLMSLGFKAEERKQLFLENFYSSDTMDFLGEIYYGTEGSEWSKTQYLDLSVVLEGDMLAKVDRMSMLNSLETRTPLLSRDLVEFAFSLPDEYKIKKKDLKHIMKDTFESILPKGFMKIPKSGFGVPLDYWFSNQLKDWVNQVLDPVKIESQGVLNAEYVQRILKEHYSGTKNRKNEIWALIVFERWYEKNIA